jgi:hypothetical protein
LFFADLTFVAALIIATSGDTLLLMADLALAADIIIATTFGTSVIFADLLLSTISILFATLALAVATDLATVATLLCRTFGFFAQAVCAELALWAFGGFRTIAADEIGQTNFATGAWFLCMTGFVYADAA